MWPAIITLVMIVANVCWWSYWQKRKQRNGATDGSLTQTSQTTEQCTRIITRNNEGGILTADGDNEVESSTTPSDCEPHSSFNSLYIANIPTTQYMQNPAEETNNLGEQDKQNPKASESKEVNEISSQEDIHRNEDAATDNTVGTSEYPTTNTTETDSNISGYHISSNTTSDCPECSNTQNSSSNGSPDSPADASSTFPVVPEEDSSNGRGDLDNVSEINSANDTQDEVITGAQRISMSMNIRFRKRDGLKVVILHSDEDSSLALTLSTDLKATRDFRVITQYEIEADLRIYPLAQRDVLDWADIIVPVVTDTWLSQINNISVTDDVDSIQRLNTRYIRILDETRFIANASLNDRTVPVVKRGTKNSYRSYPDLMDAIPISAQPSQEEVIVIGERIVKKWEIRQIIQSNLS